MIFFVEGEALYIFIRVCMNTTQHCVKYIMIYVYLVHCDKN